MLTDSAKVSVMYPTAFCNTGRVSNRYLREVPPSTRPLKFSSQYYRFLAHTIDAIADFKLANVESQAFFNKESALLSMVSFRTPMSSNARSVFF